MKFLGRDIWKERLENLILTGHIQDKRDSGGKASYLPNKFEKMDGRIGTCSDVEKMLLRDTKEVVESHNLLYTEEELSVKYFRECNRTKMYIYFTRTSDVFR